MYQIRRSHKKRLLDVVDLERQNQQNRSVARILRPDEENSGRIKEPTIDSMNRPHR